MPSLHQPPLRILFCPAWLPNRFHDTSGLFNLVLARELSAAFDLKVLYVHPHADRSLGTVFEEETEGSLKLLRAYPYRSAAIGPLRHLLYVRTFMKAFERLYTGGQRPDLIFVRGLLPAGLGAHAVHRRHGVPYITLDSFSGLEEQMRSPAKRWWVRRVLHSAVRNAGVSSSHVRTLQNIFPEIPFEVRTNVIAVAEPKPGAPGDADEPLKILYAGGVVPIKGWDLLLDALRLYIDSGESPPRVTLLGAGERAELDKRVEALGLQDHVTFLGIVPHDELKSLIRQHHFLVLPSRRDTCPNVVLETFMEGRPVLATRSGGAEDMVNETTGHLVARESPAALAEGVRYMKDHLSGFRSGRIRDYVIENHSVDALVRFLRESVDAAHEPGAPGRRKDSA